MKRVLPGMLLGVLLGLSLAACGDSDPFVPDTSTIKRTKLYVANYSAESVLEVYVKPVGASDWGANWRTGPITGGNLYAYVGEVISGRYDIRMVGELNTREVTDFNCVSEYIAVAFQP